MQKRKEPMRKCTGCRQMFSKRQLVRVVKTRLSDDENDYEISLDLVGKKAGRGAYVCKNADCLRAARKSRSLERSLECKIPDEVYEQMERQLESNE